MHSMAMPRCGGEAWLGVAAILSFLHWYQDKPAFYSCSGTQGYSFTSTLSGAKQYNRSHAPAESKLENFSQQQA